MEELLKIENLSVGINSAAGKVQAVRDVSFELHPGEVLAIVGESGFVESGCRLQSELRRVFAVRNHSRESNALYPHCNTCVAPDVRAVLI